MKHLSSLLRGGLPAALLILLWLAGPAARAQVPAWQMAMTVSQATTAESTIEQTATDASGNVFVTGSFYGTVTFGTRTLSTTPFIIYRDVFIAKWSPVTSQFVWAAQLNDALGSLPMALVVQGSSIYLSTAGTRNSIGHLYSTLLFLVIDF
ncbi:hypothetical protein [Hymenobacter siberiensis]|uniref:hypothetical protein n=1 Tax=Hymenobacter siberiensis TaxID=2848396 RepID=UPI001C1E2F19|nr:hypothetical protein [Hymenobacter siberiensis]